MALRFAAARVPRSATTATMEVASCRSSHYFSSDGRILNKEERSRENVYIQKMERERLEKLRKKMEKEATEKADKAKAAEEKAKSWIAKASRFRSSAWKVSEKHPGYNASDSDSEEEKDDVNS